MVIAHGIGSDRIADQGPFQPVTSRISRVARIPCGSLRDCTGLGRWNGPRSRWPCMRRIQEKHGPFTFNRCARVAIGMARLLMTRSISRSCRQATTRWDCQLRFKTGRVLEGLCPSKLARCDPRAWSPGVSQRARARPRVPLSGQSVVASALGADLTRAIHMVRATR